MVLELADARDMAVVHTVFLRELGSASNLVRGVEELDVARAAVIADHIALVSSVVSVHHAGEDTHVWPRLRERIPESIASIVAEMEEQHEDIHAGLEAVGKAVEDWRQSASAQTRDALADALDQLVPILREHLAVEEEHIVPLIEVHITATEYKLLAAEGTEGMPPERLPLVFGMAMYEGAPEVIESIIAEMPTEAQAVIRDLAPKAYASYAEEVYGTSTPARLRPSAR
jgi:hemerythrin-like domain-containing protein